MANNTPVPDFVSGQALLARDFASLVAAVRDLLGGQMPVVEHVRGGRQYRPFVLAGQCVPHDDAEGTPVAGVAEVLVQMGEHVTLLEDGTVDGLEDALKQAREEQVPCGLHAAIRRGYVGDMEGYSLRAESMECTAAAWLEPEMQEDGSLSDTGYHGDTVLAALMPAANVRGQVQCTPVPWVVPQHPAMVWRSANGDYMAEILTGEMCLLPAPEEEAQLLAWSGGGYYGADNTYQTVYHEWRGWLDKYGVLHLCTLNHVLNNEY